MSTTHGMALVRI